MKVVLDIDPDVVKDPRVVAIIARGYLGGVVIYDRYLLRTKQVPGVYDAFYANRIRFQSEPWAGRYEEFADALTCMKRGWADCDDLIPWRVAELQEQGIQASIKVYWRKRGGKTLFHVEARLPDGSVEDVSAYLGMKRRAG